MLVGAEKFAKAVEGKEKDVIKLYFRDAGGFVGWDYTSEENRRYKYLRYILNGGRNRQKANQLKKVWIFPHSA